MRSSRSVRQNAIRRQRTVEGHRCTTGLCPSFAGTDGFDVGGGIMYHVTTSHVTTRV
jgi:hypothetical protein